MNEIMKIRNLSKIYGKKEVRTTVLNNLSLDIEEGDFIAVMGPSGAGKSTLLNLLSTIDKPTQGSIILDGQELTAIRNEKLAKLRKENIGFIFQDYNLLDNMTLMDNIAAFIIQREGKKHTAACAGNGRAVSSGGAFGKVSASAKRRSKAAWSRCTCTDSQSPHCVCG